MTAEQIEAHINKVATQKAAEIAKKAPASKVECKRENGFIILKFREEPVDSSKGNPMLARFSFEPTNLEIDGKTIMASVTVMPSAKKK